MTLVSEQTILEFSNEMKKSLNRFMESWDQMRTDFSRSSRSHQQQDSPLETEITPKAMENMEEFDGDDDSGLDSVGRLNTTTVFYGEDPERWVCEAEECFSRSRLLSGREMVEAAVGCFCGGAWEWFQRVDQRRPVQTWKELKRMMPEQFPSPPELQLFNGENCDEGISTAEQYFEQNLTSEIEYGVDEEELSEGVNRADDELDILTDEFRSTPTKDLLPTWEESKKILLDQFGVNQISIVKEIPARNHGDESMVERAGDQFERAATMDVEEADSGGGGLEKTKCNVGAAVGPDVFQQNEFKFNGPGFQQSEFKCSNLGLILEWIGPNVSYHQIGAKPLSVGLVLEATQLHTNPIVFIGPNSFSCPNSSPSSPTITIFFTSPNTFSGSILSSSSLKLNPISSFHTHQHQQTHSNSISLQLPPFLRPPRKPPDKYLDFTNSNLEDKVLLRERERGGGGCHG